jgi:integrase
MRKYGSSSPSSPNRSAAGRCSRRSATDSGICQILTRRGRQAGIDGLHPHLFRHTWRAQGGNETDLMRIAG